MIYEVYWLDGPDRTTYTHDAYGNVLTEEWDAYMDGLLDERVVYSYDCWQ